MHPCTHICPSVGLTGMIGGITPLMKFFIFKHCSEQFRASNFGPSSYLSEQNKELPVYEMTKDGFSFLAMGYTGEKAGQFLIKEVSNPFLHI